MAVAVYLTSYFDVLNKSCNLYMQKHNHDDAFRHFLDFWLQQEENLYKNEIVLAKFRSNVAEYHAACSEAEQGNMKKLAQILKFKKIFCVPWVLAGDILMNSYPDKYDSDEFKNQVMLMALSNNDKRTASTTLSLPTQSNKENKPAESRLSSIFGNFPMSSSSSRWTCKNSTNN